MKNLLLLAAILVFACGIAAAQTTDENPLATARVFSYNDMKPRTTPNGSQNSMVFR